MLAPGRPGLRASTNWRWQCVLRAGMRQSQKKRCKAAREQKLHFFTKVRSKSTHYANSKRLKGVKGDFSRRPNKFRRQKKKISGGKALSTFGQKKRERGRKNVKQCVRWPTFGCPQQRQWEQQWEQPNATRLLCIPASGPGEPI